MIMKTLAALAVIIATGAHAEQLPPAQDQDWLIAFGIVSGST
jgi:hypothetical protein